MGPQKTRHERILPRLILLLSTLIFVRQSGAPSRFLLLRLVMRNNYDFEKRDLEHVYMEDSGGHGCESQLDCDTTLLLELLSAATANEAVLL